MPRTYEELSKDREVLHVAVEFDFGPGRELNMKFMQLARCFCGSCSLERIAERAGCGVKKLSTLYRQHFAEYVGHETLDARRKWNARHKKPSPHRHQQSAVA